IALANDPELLIADEPTTSLDVSIQAQILALLKHLQDKLRLALLLITHDFGVVRKMADRVCVMNKGEIVETGSALSVFQNPQQPYTRELLAAEPGEKSGSDQPAMNVLLESSDIVVDFNVGSSWLGDRRIFRAVDGVDISVRRGQTVGIVGESGS